MKRYSELILLPTFEERYDYLKLNGVVGSPTFGHERYLNQRFYASQEWKRARREAIIRDEACDLAIAGRDIFDKVIVHHIQPVTSEMILNRDPLLLDLDNLVCVSDSTHNAITYGDPSLLSISTMVERFSGDTCPWKKGGNYGQEHSQYNQETSWYRSRL